MPRNKNVFPALFFAIIVCLICCLGCGDDVHEEICRSSCEAIGAEFKQSFTEYPNYGHQIHYCDCRFRLPTFRKQDIPSSKEDAPKIPDKSANGANMVLR